jgi:hypothetical protein
MQIRDRGQLTSAEVAVLRPLLPPADQVPMGRAVRAVAVQMGLLPRGEGEEVTAAHGEAVGRMQNHRRAGVPMRAVSPHPHRPTAAHPVPKVARGHHLHESTRRANPGPRRKHLPSREATLIRLSTHLLHRTRWASAHLLRRRGLRSILECQPHRHLQLRWTRNRQIHRPWTPQRIPTGLRSPQMPQAPLLTAVEAALRWELARSQVA